jgi:hypothetical protein
MGRVAGKGTFGQLTSINYYAFRGKNTILLSTCVTQSLFSYQKTIDTCSCNFILNIVTTNLKMSQNMT